MPEQFYLTQETQLATEMPEHILPFWQQQVVQGKFNGVGDIPIHYAYTLHPNAIGTIVISSGRIETYLKYKELMYDFYRNGYSVFIFDHRGQGLSGRMLPRPQRGYVKTFANYVEDMHRFYEQIVKPHSHHIPKLLCHSMGGAIGALYVLKYPDDFSQVAFSSPMFGIKTPIPLWLAKILIKGGIAANRLFSDKSWYFIGQTDYLPVPFAVNTLSHSKVRYKQFRQLYDQHPQVKLGGVTFKWLQQAVLAMQHIEQQAAHIHLPVLVLQAGNDMVVENQAQDRVCHKMLSCQKIVIADGRHELLMEADSYRYQALTAILSFFAQH